MVWPGVMLGLETAMDDLPFTIYYGDGATYIGKPEGAPAHNVQAIAWDDPDKSNQSLGRVVISEWDIYIYSDHVGGWHGTNKYADVLQHLGRGCGPGGVRAVLQGAWINTDAFIAIRTRAETDGECKSASDPVREDGSE